MVGLNKAHPNHSPEWFCILMFDKYFVASKPSKLNRELIKLRRKSSVYRQYLMLMETCSAYYRIGSKCLAAVVHDQVPKSKA